MVVCRAKTLTTDAEVERYIAETNPTAPDAMLIFCFSDASEKKAVAVAQQIDAPAIAYLPTGASHHVTVHGAEEEGDRSMFSANVFAAEMHPLAEKWTSPRPPRERLRHHEPQHKIAHR